MQQQVTVELGEHIELSGFVESEPGELVIVKKIVGNFVKRFTERHADFVRLTLTNKSVHSTKVEIHGLLRWGSSEAHADVTDVNLFFALDMCLKKLDHQARP